MLITGIRAALTVLLFAHYAHGDEKILYKYSPKKLVVDRDYWNLENGSVLHGDTDYQQPLVVCPEEFEFECVVVAHFVFSLPKDREKQDSGWLFFGHKFSITTRKKTYDGELLNIQASVRIPENQLRPGGLVNIDYQFSDEEGILAFHRTFNYDDGTFATSFHWFSDGGFKPSLVASSWPKISKLNAEQLTAGLSNKSTYQTVFEVVWKPWFER